MRPLEQHPNPKSPARWRARILEISLLCFGLFGLGIVVVSYLDRQWFQMRHEQRLLKELPVAIEQALQSDGTGDHSRPSEPLEWALATRSEAATSGLVGQIRIARLGLDAMVAEGDDRRTLRNAVGHLPQTAFPGERGNVVLAGHRDSFFRGLKDIRESDRIDLVTPDGIFTYQVVKTMIVSPERTEVLESGNGSTLTLVTCYPFHYVGKAPKRFIVRAQQVFSEPSKDAPLMNPTEPERLLRA
jgi:sortase A